MQVVVLVTATITLGLVKHAGEGGQPHKLCAKKRAEKQRTRGTSARVERLTSGEVGRRARSALENLKSAEVSLSVRGVLLSPERCFSTDVFTFPLI